MGVLLMRPALALIFLVSLLSLATGGWGEKSRQADPAPIFAEKPKVERIVCLQCHDSNLVPPAYRKIPREWRTSVHYRNGVRCNDCHGGDPNNAALAMSPQKGFVGVPKPKEVPHFCGKCHIGVMQSYLGSAHAKALMTTGRGPNCVVCHGSHRIQKASINIISAKLCGVCHSYEKPRAIKAALLLTEQKINRVGRDLKELQASLIDTSREDKVLFRTQAEYRILFHTLKVKLVEDKTAAFNKKLAAVNDQVQIDFQKVKFRQNFAVLIILIFIGLGIIIFVLNRKSD